MEGRLASCYTELQPYGCMSCVKELDGKKLENPKANPSSPLDKCESSFCFCKNLAHQMHHAQSWVVAASELSRPLLGSLSKNGTLLCLKVGISQIESTSGLS